MENKETEKIEPGNKFVFSISSIQGKVFWASFLFIAILFGFTGIVFVKSRVIEESIDRIVKDSKPITYEISAIRLGLSNTIKAQRGFFITHADSFRQERLAYWKDLINPAHDRLYAISLKLETEDQQEVRTLGRLLEDFKNIQDELDAYFIQNTNRNFNSVLDLSPQETRNYVAKDQEVRNYLKQYFKDYITPRFNELNGKLKTILEDRQKTLEADVATIQTNSENFSFTMLAVLLISLVVTSALGYLLVNSLQKAISTPIQQIEQIANGIIPEDLPPTKDELNAIVSATNRLKENLKNASEFAQKIGEGKLNASYSPASENDLLGNALMQMGTRLKEVSLEDQRRNWANQGLSEFVDLIKKYQHDFELLSENFIIKLIRYLQINQGGLFTVEEKGSQKFLELRAAYAYDRRKYLEKELIIDEDFGEGLIGQAFLEKKTLHLKNVPDRYVYVTSGLGKATPRNLLIVPMKVNEQVEGMIELASFQPFEYHEISFVEDLAENFASTLVTVKNSDKMKRLLEESQMKSEQMQAQEEEMRQNMEELTATQEEMKRKQRELELLKQDLEDKLSSKDSSLRELESQIKMIGGLPTFLCQRNHNWEIISTTGNIQDVLGVDEKTFHEQPNILPKVIYPKDLEPIEGKFRQLSQKEEATTDYQVTYRIKHPKKGIRWVLDQGKLSFSEHGGYRCLSVITDITEIRPQGKASILRSPRVTQ